MEPVPLMWGQEHYWYGRYEHPRINTRIPVVWALPAGCTHARVVSAVRALIRRHQALRTTFPVGGDGRPVQLVHPPDGHSAVESQALRPGEDFPALLARTAARDIDPERERPVRFLHVTGDGTAGRLIAVFHHIAVDAASIERLWEDFTSLLAGAGTGDPPDGPGEGEPWTPTDQARLDHSAEELTYRASAASHLERCLRKVPRTLFPAFRPLPLTADGGSAEPEPVYWRLALGSARLHAAVERLSVRYRVVPSVVYFGAFAVLLKTLSGQPALVIRSAFSTRPPAHPTAVGCFFQRSLAAVDLSCARTTREALHAARDAYTDAWEFARHSYRDAQLAKAAEETRRGSPVRLSVSYSYFASPVTSQVWQQTAGLPEMTVRPRDPAKLDNDADLNLEVLLGEENRVELSLLVHRSLYDRAEASRILVDLATQIFSWDGASASGPRSHGAIAERP
ncbi:condensation domain-containing protein [Streptomyces sp. NPDC050161]|uniref:condensation domain-containing protein n=1 Tax=Streptomyces sp. NPDC050161 TaxID=3365604 RepID=UPI00378F08A9